MMFILNSLLCDSSVKSRLTFELPYSPQALSALADSSSGY